MTAQPQRPCDSTYADGTSGPFAVICTDTTTVWWRFPTRKLANAKKNEANNLIGDGEFYVAYRKES